MRTTNLLLDLNPTFNKCIPTFGPPCIYISRVLANYDSQARSGLLYDFIGPVGPPNNSTKLGFTFSVSFLSADRIKTRARSLCTCNVYKCESFQNQTKLIFKTNVWQLFSFCSHTGRNARGFSACK